MPQEALKNAVYDDYDRLIQLCDCLAGTERVLDMEHCIVFKNLKNISKIYLSKIHRNVCHIPLK